MPEDRATGVETTIRGLQLGQHALFVLLTLICSVRAVQGGASWWAQLVGAGALVAWYSYGATLARTRSRQGSWVWLAVLLALWGALVALSPENVWIAFSLWLLAGHLLPLGAALLVSALVLAVVVLAPARTDGGTSYAAVIGPAVGSLIALGVARAQGRLVRDARERQELIAALERARLSRDLHDTIAQDLVSIVMLSRTGDPAVLPQVERLAGEGLAEARRLVGELAPAPTGDTLPAALRGVLDRLREETGIVGELRVDGPVDALPTAVEVALLRSCQGAIANVRQHSGAQRVVVSLTVIPGASVHLDVVDDGRGLGAGEGVTRSPLRGGYGLRATRERLEALGGELVVESAPGEGTTLSATLPLEVA